MLRKLLGPVFLALAFPVVVAAQSQATTGIIRGTVTNPGGTPVAGATVALRETQTGFQRQVTSNERGIFIASLLPLGTYDVTARAVGFNETRRTGVVVRVGATVELALALATIELQAVTVEAAAPVVDVTRVESATRFSEEAVRGTPNNGRNYLDLTTLTPGVAIVQGPDGDEITVAGQRGIHNNVSVDGADFNNPFFGEQRGGQRAAFTFNLDAVQEMVVLNGGAPAEFGRSSSGFINVITKSGTNTLHGTAHYFGKFDALSGDYSAPTGGLPTIAPDFSQGQFGFTLGGPIVRDRAFFFLAYDQQVYDEVKYGGQTRGDPALVAWMDTAYGGALAGDFGALQRSNDARAFMGKLDFRLGAKHNLSLKYNYAWSEQVNGTFDVPSWAVSANAIEKDDSHAINGGLTSYLSSAVSNEFRFQWSRENRPRPFAGARSNLLADPNPTGDGGERPFPDAAMDFAGQYRFGMPFFIPVEYYDTRVQLLDNISLLRGDHFFKMGFEYNRVESVQTFIGFANSRYIFSSVPGFLGFTADSTFVTCSGGGTGTNYTCPVGETITGPVLLYLQQAGVDQSVIASGTQDIPQTDLSVYIQDSWKPSPQLTLNYGVRWEAEMQPDPITPPSDVFYQPFIGQSVTNATGTYLFPSDGTIPSDKSMWQPRLGITYDPRGDGRQVFRGSAGLYYARIPALNLASSRSTNGSNGFTYFRNSGLTGVLGPVPGFGSLLPDNVPANAVFFPDVFVFDKDFQNPRTLNVTVGYDRQLGANLGMSITYTYAQTDHLTRFVNRNHVVFGNPWSTGLAPGGTNGVTALTTVESSAKSRYNGVTLGIRRVLDPDFQFEANYTLSWDKSDDDNERDPFTFRHARPDNFAPEYNWSDRDQRHRVNGWFHWRVLGPARLNGRISYASAQPVSQSCGPSELSPLAPAFGERATSAADRNCGLIADDSVLTRNTLRKDNEFFSLDLGLTYPIDIGPRGRLEGIIQFFNVTGSENFKDPVYGNYLFNFDGTVAAGYGDPRQAQVGMKWVF
ncbi:MAG TPA: TonB-dependent receptor [Gemmatimonadales bacterium]|nr:TonB-dependent receptor [Gemmatimonadales bacterium]